MLATLVIAAGLLASLAFFEAVAGAYRKAQPQTALRFKSDDSGAKLALADAMLLPLAQDPKRLKAERGRIAELAREGLEGNLMDPRGYRILGIFAEMDGNLGLARRYLEVAQAMSRRDVMTQLWLIEDDVRRESIVGALKHYDIALTTSREIWPLLMPVLQQAVAEKEVRDNLVPYVRGGRNWMESFLSSTSSTTAAPDLARLMIQAGRGSWTNPSALVIKATLTQLVTMNQYALAHQFYRAAPTAPQAVSRSLAVDSANTDPLFTPIAWEMIPAAEVTVKSAGRNGGISIDGDVLSKAIAARKLVALDAGRYRMRVAFEWADPIADGSASLILRCVDREEEKPIAIVPMEAGGREATAILDVSANCRVQEALLSFNSGEASRQSFTLSSVELSKT